MNFYDVSCEVHGAQEARASMKQAMEGPLPCPALLAAEVDGKVCGLPTQRLYTVPYENSDNLFPGAGRYSQQLSDGADPVFVKNKAHERELMAKKGLAHWEKGMRPPPTRKERISSPEHQRERKKLLRENWRKANSLDLDR